MIDLTHLKQISRGNKEKELYYLRQFQELIPVRLDQLKVALHDEQQDSIRQIIHIMSPQLEFFGIMEVKHIKKLLETDETFRNVDEMKILLNHLIAKIAEAIKEINDLILKKLG